MTVPLVKVSTVTWARRCGEWRKKFRAHLQVRASEEVQSFADDVRRKVQKMILAGEVGGPPLSEEWSKDKKRRGKDGRKLIETGSMVENIQVVGGKRTEKGKEGVVFGVGVFEGKSLRGAPRALPVIHEGGRNDGSIPARPVWVRAVIETKATSPAYRRLTRGKWFDLRGGSARFKE